MSTMHHSVYVIELSIAIWLEEPKFRAKNPDYKKGLPCVYVGSTGLTPEERFKNHRSGYKSSRYVKKYGFRLMPDLYEIYNPMTWKQACKMEIYVAKKLRNEGYGVWQN